MKYFIPALMLMFSLQAAAEEIITPANPFTGWNWYNEPKPNRNGRKPAPPPKRYDRQCQILAR